MATWYVDFEGSAGAGDGTSFANRSNNIVSIVNGSANGDEVRVKASADPVSIGSCTWTKNSTIAIPAGTTKDIYTDGAWTGSANVTSGADTVTSRRFEGANISSNSIAAGFTTGKIAYYSLGSTQDFSSYEKISLSFWTSVALASADIFYIALCSDATGDTVVDTLTLPAFNMLANRAVKLLLDNGGPLGSSIQSIAIYATTDPGTRVVYIDNVFATNDLNLSSLISKDAGEWFAIRCIANDTITIGQQYLSAVSVADRGYCGDTATAETFVSNGVPTNTVTASTTSIYNFTKSAAAGAEVLISGGWNRTDMSTRTGATHIMNLNVLGRIFTFSGAYTILENFIISSANDGVQINNNNITIRNCALVGMVTNGLLVTGTTRVGLYMENCHVANCSSGLGIIVRVSIISNCKVCNCGIDGIYVSGNMSKLTNIVAKNNTSSGLYVQNCAAFYVDTVLSENNGLYGLEVATLIGGYFANITCASNSSGGVYILTVEGSFYNLTTENNGSGGGVAFIDAGGVGTLISIFNFQYNEATVINNLADYDGARYISINENNTADDHAIYQETGTIVSDVTTRHTASGISWKLMPTASSVTVDYPLIQRIRAVPLKANVEHTVSIWARRDNTGLTFTFGCDNQGVSGISSQTVSMTAAADTWEKLSLTLTPTVDVVLDFYVSVYGGTTYNGWWDDFEVVAASKNEVSSGDYGYANNGAYVTSYPTSPASGGETAYLFC